MFTRWFRPFSLLRHRMRLARRLRMERQVARRITRRALFRRF